MAIRRRWGARTLVAFGAAIAISAPLATTPMTMAAPVLPVVDDFEEPLPSGTAGTVPTGFFVANDPNSTTAFERTADLPEPVPESDLDNEALRTEFSVEAFGVVLHNFTNEAADQWVTQDWSSYEGLQFWIHGTGSGIDLFVDVVDNRPEGSVVDDGERFTAAFTDDVSGWRLVQLPFAEMSRKEIGNGAPNDGFQLTEVHGYAFGSLRTEGTQSFYIDDVAVYGVAPERPLTVGFAAPSTTVVEGETATIGLEVSKASDQPIEVQVITTTNGPAAAGSDYTPIDTTVTIPAGETSAQVSIDTFGDEKYQAERIVLLEIGDVSGAELGLPPGTRLVIADDETPDPSLVEDFERQPYFWTSPSGDDLTSLPIQPGDTLELPGQSAKEGVLVVEGSGEVVSAQREFAIAEDWTGRSGLDMWVYGNNSGENLTMTLTNPTVEPGSGNSEDWPLAWSDEFDAPAGLPPNPDIWTAEVGDGTVIGKPGWGNDERQYYTDSTDNVAHDGDGNLVITTREEGEDTDLLCYYGACEYSSGRIMTQDKYETAYGRLEARVQVPVGQGLWPAFWTLGDDIVENPWPQSGEIDIMEHVGREPDEVFGTIHGPGYNGGQAYGNFYTFDVPVADDFHEFAVEWRPEEIIWEVDGIQYHEAIPADVDPNEWVFEHPYFFILNTAIGGNFGGTIGEIDFPQETTVEYVRVYQPDRQPESFTASVVDDFSGWRQVNVPFADFVNAEGGAVDVANVGSLELSASVAEGEQLLVDQIRVVDSEELVDRVGGADRYETAALVATEFASADVVYIASGADFPDALTARTPPAPGASTQESSAVAAPVLLTELNGLPQASKDALAQLDPARIRIIGGTAVVSADVEAELGAYGEVSRFAGANRYATSAAVSELFPTDLSVVYIATGESFPDAMAGGAAAALNGSPVLLTMGGELPSETASALQRLDPQSVVVIGGPGAVSPTVASEIEAIVPQVSRVAGADRYATSVALAQAVEPDVSATLLASGESFPDALSGGALAGATGGPLLLTKPTALADGTWAEFERLSPEAITIVGGPAAVSLSIEDRLNGSLPNWAQ